MHPAYEDWPLVRQSRSRRAARTELGDHWCVRCHCRCWWPYEHVVLELCTRQGMGHGCACWCDSQCRGRTQYYTLSCGESISCDRRVSCQLAWLVSTHCARSACCLDALLVRWHGVAVYAITPVHSKCASGRDTRRCDDS